MYVALGRRSSLFSQTIHVQLSFDVGFYGPDSISKLG